MCFFKCSFLIPSFQVPYNSYLGLLVSVSLTFAVTASVLMTSIFFFFCSCTVITPSGSKKAEDTKPKKPVVVLSLDTSKVKPKETKVMNVLKRTSV